MHGWLCGLAWLCGALLATLVGCAFVALGVFEAAVSGAVVVVVAELGVSLAGDRPAAPPAWLAWHERIEQLGAQLLVLAPVAACGCVGPGVGLLLAGSAALLAW